jgi:hypothetical protein
MADLAKLQAVINDWRFVASERPSDNMVYHYGTIVAILKDLEAAMAAPAWQDVATVPLGKPVLLSYENGSMFVGTARLRHNGDVLFQHDGYDPAIKYWQPLPAPPKPEQKDPA